MLEISRTWSEPPEDEISDASIDDLSEMGFNVIRG